MTCAEFSDQVAELALGVIDARESDALLAHAAGCASCRAELDELTAIADRTATIAPEAEPPVGFEQRALAAMTRHSRAGAWRVAAAAAVVLVLAATGAAIGWNANRDARLQALDRVGVHNVRSGPFVDRDGRVQGSAMLTTTGGASSHSTLTMSLRYVEPGTYHCAVRTAAGQLVEVAAWPIERKGGSTWAVRLRGNTTKASGVVITADGGSEVATADLR